MPSGPATGQRTVSGSKQERPLADRYILALDPVDARAADDDVDLLLATVGLVVLAPDDVRPELEPVDAERLDAELTAHEPDRASGTGGLDVVDVRQRVAHA
jgi:hypothetical protein